MKPMRNTIRFLVTIGSSALVLCGCATRRGGVAEPVFYPPPPDVPRLQYLKSFSSSDDIADQGWFSQFILGKFAPDPINKPYGVALSSNRVYVCDTMLRAVCVLDLAGHRFDYFVPSGEGRLSMPVNIAVADDGFRYVADSGRGQVLVFDEAGHYLAALGKKTPPRSNASAGHAATTVAWEKGSPGSDAPGSLTMKPVDVLATSNLLYVADLTPEHVGDVTTRCVRVFNRATRELVMTIPRSPTNKVGWLDAPTNLALDKDGRLYVTDTVDPCVKMYDAEGRFVRSFGRFGNSYGELARPKGVAVDRDGRVYVADAGNESITIFDADGKLLLSFGQPGTTPLPLTLPAKVAIDYANIGYFQPYAAPGFQLEYLVFVTCQYGLRKVDVYGFGRRL